MAQAAPVSGTPGTSGSTDVFGEQTHTMAKWAVPVVGGLVYGYWAAAINRDAGAITGWNVLFGFVCAIAFAAAYMGARTVAPLMRREAHALVWAVFAGCAFGFLYSQTDATILRSVFMSLPVAVGVYAVAFYRYYTHEDAAGKAG
ncbi:hypothetical protein [Streptomyces sp. NBC_00328]|uniref:hypothetical protein n=1 Tax=Streptomyces sp. NBC_00328 TaxID=2903646 RepID=UPI002E2ADE8B|nr:hypothetical protein [Streptomyces sp. NBC_00328]